MNNGIGKSIYQRINGGFGLPFMKQNQQIRGILVEKNGQSIRIDTGNKRLMELKLNREIDAKTGDVVVIDKRDILQSRAVALAQNTLKQEEIGIYSKMLQSFNLPIKDELLSGLKTLDMQGIQLSKENLLTLMMSKNQLDSIYDGLDYDTAIGLMEEEIDIENEPISRVAASLEEVKSKGQGFSIARFLKDQFNISTDEAERIATELYGGKMGKDYTDIIKALNKAGIDITRKNVDRVNDIFTKLHQLKDLGEDTIINTIKNKLEASIDNLVKLKNSVTRSIIAVDEKIGQYASRLYESNTQRSERITERDLILMEEEIKTLLSKEGLNANKENIRLAKELIKEQVPVSAENIESINNIRAAIRELASKLDHQRIGELLRDNVNVEKASVTSLVKMLQDLENSEKLSDSMKLLTKEEKAAIGNILDSLKSLKTIKDEDLVTLLKKGVDIKLADIEKLVTVNSKSQEDIKLQDTQLLATYNASVEMSEVLNQVRAVSFNAIAFHINNSYDLTLEQFARSHNAFMGIAGSGDASASEHSIAVKDSANVQGVQNSEIIKALMNQQMPVNKAFADKLLHIKNQLSYIKDNVTTNIIAKSLEDQLSLTKLEIDKTASYIREYNGTDKVALLQEAIPQMPANRQHLLAMLMKNGMPMSLKSVKELSMLFNNKSNIAHDLKELMALLAKDSNEGQELGEKLQAGIKELLAGTKQGKLEADRFYEELDKTLRLLQDNAGLLDKETRRSLENKIEKIKDTLEAQQQLNKNDTCFQMPVFMKEELRNLQIYVMNKKKNTKKIDPQNMSILLNMETASVGNLCIYAAVNNRSVMLKIGLDQPEYKRIVEPQAKVLIGLMKDIGYDVKEVGFRVNEEQSMLDMLNHTEHEESLMKHYIDMKI